MKLVNRIKNNRTGVAVFIAILSFAWIWSSRQPQPNNTIRVAIDRAPIGLNEGQALDVMGRKIAPLLSEYELNSNTSPDLVRLTPKSSLRPEIEFHVIRDESTRALAFLRGDVDVLYNTLSLIKTEWIKKQKPAPRIFTRSGLTLSFLAYSLKHPILKDIRVRRALTRALHLSDWIQYKFYNWVDRFPLDFGIVYNPELAERELDELGYPKNPQGIRFSLQYYTTNVREGQELALWVSDSLSKIGVDVKVVTLDSILYFQKMKKGESDLFSLRWFRLSQQEPIDDYLKTGGIRNYFQYSNPALDRRLKKNPVLSERELDRVIQDDLPFYPLYSWRNGLIVSERIQIEQETQLLSHLDETFRFLLDLKLK